MKKHIGPHLLQALIGTLALPLALSLATPQARAADKPAAPTNLITLTSKNTALMPWEEVPLPAINAKIAIKALQHDPSTGMNVWMVRYPAGHTTSWHTHPCAHGIYVLDGTLKTNQGEFGPGTWVWFPEGGWMEHGATAQTDATFLFITNKEFGIEFAGTEKVSYPMHK